MLRCSFHTTSNTICVRYALVSFSLTPSQLFLISARSHSICIESPEFFLFLLLQCNITLPFDASHFIRLQSQLLIFLSIFFFHLRFIWCILFFLYHFELKYALLFFISFFIYSLCSSWLVGWLAGALLPHANFDHYLNFLYNLLCHPNKTRARGQNAK